MIVLNAYACIKPEALETALEACRVVKSHSVKEPGCEKYDYYQSPEEPTKIVFVEEWTTKAHLDVHFQQDAFKQFFAVMSTCFQAHPELRIFEANLVE